MAAADPRVRGLCLDKKTGSSELGTTRVEFCDLLLPDSTFIHVKKADGSQSLSHLFAQGSTSTVLLARRDPRFRSELDELLAEQARAHATRRDLLPRRVVYAIATKSSKPVRDSLFTIAKVALLAHYELIRTTGIPVYLSKITYG